MEEEDCVRHFAVLGHNIGNFRQAGRSVYRQFFLEEYFQQFVIHINKRQIPIHSMDMTISLRPLTAETRVPFRSFRCGTYGRNSDPL
jgi:hypothetical protein